MRRKDSAADGLVALSLAFIGKAALFTPQHCLRGVGEAGGFLSNEDRIGGFLTNFERNNKGVGWEMSR